MNMLPNDHHPGPRCSCAECQRRYPEVSEPAQPTSKDQISAERLSDLIASCIFQSETGGHGDGYVAFLYDIACACMELQRRRASLEPRTQSSKDLTQQIREALEDRPAWSNADAATRFGALLGRALTEIELQRCPAPEPTAGWQRIARERTVDIAIADAKIERLQRELDGANRTIANFMGPEGDKYIDRFAAMLAGPVSPAESIRKYSAHEPKSNPGGTGLEQSPSGCGDGHGDSGLTPGGAGGGRASGIPILREALEEACRECACTVRERDSGHRVECSVPRWREILDSTTPPPADATDAARYRWLRGHVAPSVLERITSTPKSLIADKRSEALDAEIDLRRAGKIGAGSGPTKFEGQKEKSCLHGGTSHCGCFDTGAHRCCDCGATPSGESE